MFAAWNYFLSFHKKEVRCLDINARHREAELIFLVLNRKVFSGNSMQIKSYHKVQGNIQQEQDQLYFLFLFSQKVQY